MEDLLTTRQVQDLLQVDRTTIYRMRKDGRLSGVRVGQQWRFPRQEVEHYLGLTPESPTPQEAAPMPQEILPLNCVQSVQDVCAEIAEISAVTTDLHGNPLTRISNCGRFCRLLLNSESGRRACEESWRRLVQGDDEQLRFVTCHAGLQYAHARIELNGANSAMIIAGQFYTTPHQATARDSEIRALADQHKVDADSLVDASRELVFLDDRKKQEITRWLNKVAQAFEQIGRERADLMGRLKQIATMSNLGA
ncbi:MAG: PocR ligand-binding domain-containing protein [Anaerolineales bacterium]|nr:PocR ligand-binding domain-containing protein [Anaerolineales bacterium]